MCTVYTRTHLYCIFNMVFSRIDPTSPRMYELKPILIWDCTGTRTQIIFKSWWKMKILHFQLFEICDKKSNLAAIEEEERLKIQSCAHHKPLAHDTIQPWTFVFQNFQLLSYGTVHTIASYPTCTCSLIWNFHFKYCYISMTEYNNVSHRYKYEGI